MKLEQSEPHKIVGKLDHYRCKHCGHQIQYGTSHPPGTI